MVSLASPEIRRAVTPSSSKVQPSDLKLKFVNVQAMASFPLPYVHTAGSASLLDLDADDRYSARFSVSAWQSMSAAVTVRLMVLDTEPVLMVTVFAPALSNR